MAKKKPAAAKSKKAATAHHPDSSCTQNVGLNIREAREAAGISRTKLGRLLDCDPQTIYRWENGGPTMTVERLGQIAKVLRVSVESLLSGK